MNGSGKLYETEREEMPVLDEFILEYRWFMCADTRGRVSQCLRVGRRRVREAYQAVLSKEIGKPVNQVIEHFLRRMMRRFESRSSHS